MLRRLVTLVRTLLQRRRAARELDDELQFHVDMATQSNVAAGMPPQEARRVALRDLGGIEQTKEAVHDVRRVWLDSLYKDVCVSLRMLRRSPGFAAVSLLSLALGIGVNLSVFSFVNALFLRPLPVADPDGLVSLHLRSRTTSRFTGASFPDFEYLRLHSTAFADLIAHTTFPMTVRGNASAELVEGELVSGNYFGVLGVSPAAGRVLDLKDDQPHSAPAVVISYQFWKARFDGDPDIVGRAIHVGSSIATIVGIAPQRFRGLVIEGTEPAALWVPLALYKQAVPALADLDNLERAWGMQTFNLTGRLKQRVRLREAAAEAAILARQLDRERVASLGESSDYANLEVVLAPAAHSRVPPSERGTVVRFLVLLGAVAILIFFVACFNVANLIVARATSREHEIAVRSSLGASWRRIVQQLLIENLTLSVLAAALALPIAVVTFRSLGVFGDAAATSLAADSDLDIRLILFALAVAALAGMLLTVVPARVARRACLTRGLALRSRRFGPRVGAQAGLVGVQVALSVILLIGAGLFVRTLLNALAADVTVRPERVLLATVDPDVAGYDDARSERLYSQLLDRIRQLPGVAGAAQVFIVPLGGRRGGTNIERPAADRAGGPLTMQVGFNVVSPGYFETIGLPLLAGRDFNVADRPGSPRVAVINQVMAARLFPGANPIGRRLLLKSRREAWVEIVGMIRDGKFRAYNVEAEPTVYVPLAQHHISPVTLVVRAEANPLALVQAVRHELALIDPNLPLTRVQTAKSHFQNVLWKERLTATLLSGLGVLALVLAAIGVYGILSFAVAQRTWEIGLRIALGARPLSVVSMIVTRLFTVLTAGALAGALGALALTRVIRGLLYEVSPMDPVVIVSSAFVLLATAVFAAVIPARRAATVDPASVLRSE
jgi:predicted permease